MVPIRIGVIGAAWRAEFYLRIAAALPGRFEIVGMTSRNAERRAELDRTWGVATFDSPEAMATQAKPDFVVTSVPPEVNPELIGMMNGMGLPVLSETPPAKTVDELVALHERCGEQAGGRIQVAEQFHLQPHQAARIAVARSGRLGEISQVQVSASHTIHQVSLIRRMLGIGFEACTITGHALTSPMILGPNREGPPPRDEIVPARQEFFHFDWGERHGVFDFTENQHRSWARFERVMIRGDRGELLNNRIKFVKDYLTPMQLDLVRHEAGPEANLEGHHLKAIQCGEEVVYVNPCAGARLSDEEIAMASCLDGMARYVRTGEPFYSLAEGCQDKYLSLMCEKSLESGGPVQTRVMPWAKA